MTLLSQHHNIMTQQPAPIPHHYLILHHSQRCACCGRTHDWSELFAVSYLRPTLGFGKPVTNLRSLDTPEFNLPIVRKKLPAKPVPFCHSCFHPSLHDLPDPPSRQPSNTILNLVAKDRPKEESPTPPRHQSTTKRHPSSLLSLLK